MNTKICLINSAMGIEDNILCSNKKDIPLYQKKLYNTCFKNWFETNREEYEDLNYDEIQQLKERLKRSNKWQQKELKQKKKS